MKQSFILTLDLSANDDIGRRFDAALHQHFAVALLHFAQCITGECGNIEERMDRPDRVFTGGCVLVPVKDVDDSLCDRQIAAGEQHDDTVPRLLIDAHFAERRNVIHAGIGA